MYVESKENWKEGTPGTQGTDADSHL
jgi:hypothetical protein